MPSAVSSPARGSSRSAPSRISSSAVAGLATGMRIRAGSGARGGVIGAAPRGSAVARPLRPAASGRLPALDEVRLQQLELAGLALDAVLGLLGRLVAVLDDEAADAPEVDRDERGDERLDRRLVRPGADDEVVDQPGPQVVREVERGEGLGHLDGRRRVVDAPSPADPQPRPGRVDELARLAGEDEDRLGVLRREHPAPRVGEGQRARRGTPSGGGSCSPRAAAGR